VTQPDRPRGRGKHRSPAPVKALAASRGVKVLQPEKIRDPAFLEEVRALAPDLGVVAAYGKILPDELLSVPRLGFLNIHASLLPRYRGAAPVHRAVIDGERVTGVSIMRVVRELDAGPVFASSTHPIGPDDTSVEVEQMLSVLGADLLADVIDDVSTGQATAVPQEDHRATYAPKLTKDDGRLDWNQPAERIHDRVRGVHPWPHAYAFLKRSRYVILRTSLALDVLSEARGKQTSYQPGSIVRAHGADLVVAAGGSALLRILDIQPENRRAMSAREFLAGHHVQPGDRFEEGSRSAVS